MIFHPTPLESAYVIQPERHGDNRGYFTRTYCVNEFAAVGLSPTFCQANAAYTALRGTTRGLHYQIEPHQEAKLIRCTRGRVFDAIVDVREKSKTYLQWFGVELNEDNGTQLYVPEGFANGYQVLEDNSEISYLVSAFYEPSAERGLRWNDPRIGIEWPITEGVEVSDKDAAWALL